VRDDGVPVSWVTRQHTSCEPGFLEKAIGDIMQPAPRMAPQHQAVVQAV
jgi:hypothetical protein